MRIALALLIATMAGLFAAYRTTKPAVQGQSLGGGILEGFTVLTLDNFQPWEFREFWSDMSPELLKKLDKFRDLWGAPVTVSTNPDALGRHLGPGDTSQHNIDRWGEVRAADIFPEGLNAQTKAFAIQCAKQAGFTGIGIYTDTTPGWMMHVDVRPDRNNINPATWARVSGQYVGIGVA